MTARVVLVVRPSYPSTQTLARQYLLWHSWDPDHRCFGVGHMQAVPYLVSLLLDTKQNIIYGSECVLFPSAQRSLHPFNIDAFIKWVKKSSMKVWQLGVTIYILVNW